jgi:hypothetical protein
LFLLGSLPGTEIRLYKVIQPIAKGCYRSKMSSGTRVWTLRDQGPHGEEIIDRREFAVLDGDSDDYIASARDWGEVRTFLRSMRITIQEVEVLDPGRRGDRREP